MGIIAKMPISLANLIAAGEVVDRPSSVVKELVENSIDAKASEIKIYLTNYGLNEIKIIDDGIGMDSDDVKMSFMPHATSKIKNEYDLYRIKTLGFRGEAIASIAQVSDMTIISSTNGNGGYLVRYKAGSMIESKPFNHNKGTTVIVNSLFYNTPARLKYLKSEKSELASIMFYVDRIAMAKRDMRFSVYNDNKLIFQTTGTNNNQSLMLELYGIEAAKNIIEHKYQKDGYSVELLFAKPMVYRSNKLEITLIVNNRYVKNYNITNAVVKAFETYLPINKYPIGIIYLNIDPLLIDVNVHPAKTEIKISNEDGICNDLIIEIKSMLNDNHHIPKREIIEQPKYEKTNIFNYDVNDIKPKFNENINNNIYNSNIIKDEEIKAEDNVEDNKSTMEYIKDNTEVIIENKLPQMDYIGQLFGTYLLFQDSSNLILMDQHAAAERINYEYYVEILSKNDQPKTNMLFPISISLSKSEMIDLNENINKFEELGFSISSIGPTEIAIREIPLWAKPDMVNDIFYDILNSINEFKQIDVLEFRNHIAKQIACKASIKANHRISLDEVNALIKNLNKCKNPYTCPHGRPTIIYINEKDLEKMFERIQSK